MNNHQKKLVMRSRKRGIREMDLVFGPFADAQITDLAQADIDAYEALLTENDHDIFQWIAQPDFEPDKYSTILALIRDFHGFAHC